MPSPRLLRTTAFRQALLYLGLFVVSVLVILGQVYWFTIGVIEQQTDDTVKAEIDGLRDQYAQHGMLGLVAAINARSQVPHSDAVYLVITPGLRPVAGNLSHWPDVEPDRQGWITFSFEQPGRDGPETHPARAAVFALPGGHRLLVGHDLQAREAFRRRVIGSLVVALVLTVSLGALGAVLISRGVVRRVDAINRTTGRIMAGALHERVAPFGSDDEFDRLAENLNAMLDQIERLMTGMRLVTESVAHDLRTPLTRLRSRLELAMIEPAGADSARAALAEAIAETDAVLATFTALLSIAEAEAGSLQAGFTPVALGTLGARLADLYEPGAEEKGLALATDIAGDPEIPGNSQLLSQAVANLLDNAIKYTPAGGRITLSVAPGAAGAGPRLTVADSGPGVPEADRERVLQRFVRLEASRSTPGSGLGLALVDAVARLHCGHVVLEDNAPGLRASLVFPPQPPGAGRGRVHGTVTGTAAPAHGPSGVTAPAAPALPPPATRHVPVLPPPAGPSAPGLAEER